MAKDVRNFAGCPVEITAQLIGSKWKILIIKELMDETKRFGVLQKSVGRISQKVLTTNLRDLEKNRLIQREVFPEVPPRVEYSLTDLGKSLESVINVLANWGMIYHKSIIDLKNKRDK